MRLRERALKSQRASSQSRSLILRSHSLFSGSRDARRKLDTICNYTAWTFTDSNRCIKRLGFLSGYPQTLTSYVLYSTLQDPIGYVHPLSTEHLNRLLPLPYNPPLERPAGFGSPISVDVMRILVRPAWLITEIVGIKMRGNSAVSCCAALGYERY